MRRALGFFLAWRLLGIFRARHDTGVSYPPLIQRNFFFNHFVILERGRGDISDICLGRVRGYGLDVFFLFSFCFISKMMMREEDGCWQ